MPDISIQPHDERAIDAVRVQALYATEGWWPERTIGDIETILDHAAPALAAWQDEHLIGFVRAVSDGVARAYVEDVVVDPDYRSRGVGGGLLAELNARLAHVHVISLFCGNDLVPFYEAYGYRFTNQRVGHRRQQPAR